MTILWTCRVCCTILLGARISSVAWVCPMDNVRAFKNVVSRCGRVLVPLTWFLRSDLLSVKQSWFSSWSRISFSRWYLLQLLCEPQSEIQLSVVFWSLPLEAPFLLSKLIFLCESLSFRSFRGSVFEFWWGFFYHVYIFGEMLSFLPIADIDLGTRKLDGKWWS